MKEEIQKVVTESKIKLIKGQRDNYGWEITLPKRDDQSYAEWIKELENINKELVNSFIITKSQQEVNNGNTGNS